MSYVNQSSNDQPEVLGFDSYRFETIYFYVIDALEQKLGREATDEEAEDEFERIQGEDDEMAEVYKATGTKPEIED